MIGAIYAAVFTRFKTAGMTVAYHVACFYGFEISLCFINSNLAGNSGLGTREELEAGFLCDPASKSSLRILARPGVTLRLTRNLDKGRGFVNGALAVVCESLQGNSVFVAKLVGSGTYVLVHPMEEEQPFQ